MVYKRVKTKFGQNRFLCLYCGSSFKRKRGLLAHFLFPIDCYVKSNDYFPCFGRRHVLESVDNSVSM